jgi:hypothetical protein
MSATKAPSRVNIDFLPSAQGTAEMAPLSNTELKELGEFPAAHTPKYDG